MPSRKMWASENVNETIFMAHFNRTLAIKRCIALFSLSRSFIALHACFPETFCIRHVCVCVSVCVASNHTLVFNASKLDSFAFSFVSQRASDMHAIPANLKMFSSNCTPFRTFVEFSRATKRNSSFVSLRIDCVWNVEFWITIREQTIFEFPLPFVFKISEFIWILMYFRGKKRAEPLYRYIITRFKCQNNTKYAFEWLIGARVGE